ncbi:MAG: hypothetical protein H7Z73_01470 [Candidatus Saccharibacteria bacterium]|nr:hypothetical protein [Moraxellaceae bacterium]
MSCSQCQNEVPFIKIKVPQNLKEAIITAKSAVESGCLVYRGMGNFADPFKSIASGSGWGDFVSNYFTCASCGQWFHLHAETYHGSGGALERIPSQPQNIQNDAY